MALSDIEEEEIRITVTEELVKITNEINARLNLTEPADRDRVEALIGPILPSIIARRNIEQHGHVNKPARS